MKNVAKKEGPLSPLTALLNEYSTNSADYAKMFNNSQSFFNQFLEGLYKKYSRSLEAYMKKNKQNLRLVGSKRYQNVPIDLFLKEAKVFKEAILKELHDKYKANGSSLSKEIVLTPLPDKPRVLLTTQAEKDEFLTAERLAVVMRTVEYTQGLKGVGQYASMKNEEKVQMIFIMKKAASIIQSWWASRGKGGTKRRRRRAVRLFGRCLMKVDDCFWRCKLMAWNCFKNKVNQFKLKIESNELTLSRETMRMKRLLLQWEYYTKAISLGYVQSNLSVLNKPFASIVCLQSKVRKFLSKECENGIKSIQHFKLLKLFYSKSSMNENSLLSAFLHWFHIISYFNSKLSLYRKDRSSLPEWYTSLPTLLHHISQERLESVLVALKTIQRQKKGISDSAPISLKKDNAEVAKSLMRLLTKRNERNGLWKGFQLWNMLNIVIHILVNKLTNVFITKSRQIFLVKLKQEMKHMNKDNNTPVHQIVLNHTNSKANANEVIIRYYDEIRSDTIF